jgi:hypothetical protein
VIQINISWIFLALCSNGIESKEMLELGITRDMFLIACNPRYETIRQLVITSFAQLGISDDKFDEAQSKSMQDIKEVAVFGISRHIQDDPSSNIKILLHFSASLSKKHQYIAYWCLKDHILFNQ